MPTQAQNEVYKKYGLRKGEVRQGLQQARDILVNGVYHTKNAFMTREDTALMHVAVSALPSLGDAWRAYQECDRDG